MIDGGRKAFQTVPVVLQRIIEDRLWSERVDRNGKPFQSFEAFATHILWQGLESSIDDLLIYCRKRPDVQALIRGEVGAIAGHGGDRKGEPNQGDIVTLKTQKGNSPTYALKRLRRDRPAEPKGWRVRHSFCTASTAAALTSRAFLGKRRFRAREAVGERIRQLGVCITFGLANLAKLKSQPAPR